jgi:hypothetical protein
MDPYPDSDPDADPAIFVIDFQDANDANAKKVQLHHFQR